MLGEIQKNNSVFHNKANQQNQPHKARDIQRRAGDQQQRQRPHKRERRGEQHDQWFHKRAELHDHHGHHAERCERQHHEQCAKRRLLARVAPADFHPDSRRRRIGVKHGLHVGHDFTQRAGANSGGERDHLLLIFTQVCAAHIGRREIRQ